MELILDIQADEWWVDVSYPMLEDARKRHRAAAKQAFNRFLDDKRYSRNQITFVNLVIDYLTEHGTIDPGRVYDSPFTSVAPEGPETIFIEGDLDDFFEIVRQLHDAAAP